MVVLDSFPFQEDGDVQYLGGLRRSVHASAGDQNQRRSCFDSPEECLFDSGNYSSNSIHQSSMCVRQADNSHENGEQVMHSQEYMEGVENAQGFLKCRLCHYQTKFESLLQRHVMKHSSDSDFQCPACDFRETDPSNFVDHIGTHQSGRLVRCCFCPKKMSRGKLKSHIRIHRAVELYDCSMCQFSTNYEKTINRHMDVYHSKQYSCHQCDLIMTKHDLHWHMKFTHAMEPVQTSAVPEQTVPLPVPAGRGTNSKTPNIPTKSIPNQSIFSHKFGSSKISRKNSVALKMQKHVMAKKQFNCGKCDYKTSLKKLLRAHRAKHLLDNSLVCTKCDLKETGPGKFASHLALHSPEGLFECCFCGFQTPTRGTMSNHVTKHKPIPMFDCSECEFSAKRPSSVRIHTINVHGKRSRCRFCGTEMSRSAMLHHRKECHRKILNPRAGPSSQPLEYENHKLDTERDALHRTGDPTQADDNIVICEFCKKPYAKSYIRKHLKKCHIETVHDAEARKSGEFKSVLPQLQPVGSSLTSDGFATVLIPNGTGEEPEPDDFSLFQSNSLSKSSNKPKKLHLKCNSCSFKTTKKRLLKKHVLKHFVDFRLTCPECGHKEMSSFKFAHHILQHGSDPDTFQCCFCSLSAPTSKRSYCAHLDLHRPVSIFDCPKCEYSSNRADCVRNHCKNNHYKNRKCQHCGKIMSKARLFKHLLESHGEVRDLKFKLGKAQEEAPNEDHSHPQRIKPVVFNLDGISGQSTTHKQDVEDKMQVPSDISRPVDVPNPPEIEEPLFETEEDFLKCTKCTFRTKMQSLMDRHVAKHLKDVPFVCPLCGYEHLSSRKFATHWDKHECHAKKKIYQCCFCDAEIKKKNCLKAFLPQHIEEHRPVTLQDCSECEFSSHSRYELDKHYKNQHVKKCECLLCGDVMTIFEYSFHAGCMSTVRADRSNDSPETAKKTDHQVVDFSTLRRHSAEIQESLIAALEDPASLFYAEPSSLADDSSRAHSKSHRPNCVTKQNMHCSSCDYKTPFKSLLERHVLKHIEDVPFPCSKCSFISFDERTFADHIFTHTHSYKCHFCSYRAVNAAAATRHFSSHKVLAMHDCPKCEYTSTYKYRLVEHLKGKHVNVPRCSYCSQKMSKGELYAHERVCGKSSRSKDFGHLIFSREIEIPEDKLTQALQGTSPGKYLRAPFSQILGLDEECPVERMGTADNTEMKGLLLHQLDLVPTQAHVEPKNPLCPGSMAKSSTHTEVQHVIQESKSAYFTPDVGLKYPVCLDSMSKSADSVPALNQESNSTDVEAENQGPGLRNPVDTSFTTNIYIHADDLLTQNCESNSKNNTTVGQNSGLNHPVFPASLPETSTTADDEPTVHESESATGIPSQDPGMASTAETAAHAKICLQ